MLTSNPSFLAVAKVHQVKAKAKPCPYEQTNFEEFRKVYSEKKLSVENSHYRPSSARPKNYLKTIKLQLPLLGSENAIVGVPVLPKKAPIKSILKKTLSTPMRSMRPKDLVKKLARVENEETKIKASTRPLTAPTEDMSDKRNNKVDAVEIKQKQTSSMMPKVEKVSQIRKKLPLNKIKIDFDYLITKYPSKIRCLLQKDKEIRKTQNTVQKNSKPFHQEEVEDVEVLYENKTYLEDLKGIIDGLDDIMSSDE